VGSDSSLGQEPAPRAAEPSAPPPRSAASDVRATVLALQRSNATTLATGLHTHADVTAPSGATRGTAAEMKVKRWIVVKGTGTAQKVDSRNADALKTLVKLGLLDATDVPAVQGQPRSAVVNLGAPRTAHTTWAALCSALEQDIANYIAAAFPTQIDCYARLYKRTSSTADWDKTVQQHHTLTNHR
jgi:hypothetical protein